MFQLDISTHNFPRFQVRLGRAALPRRPVYFILSIAQIQFLAYIGFFFLL